MATDKKPSRKNLPTSKNGVRRKAVHFTAFGYERESLHLAARKAGMSTNLFLNVNFWPAHVPDAPKRRRRNG